MLSSCGPLRLKARFKTSLKAIQEFVLGRAFLRAIHSNTELVLVRVVVLAKIHYLAFEDHPYTPYRHKLDLYLVPQIMDLLCEHQRTGCGHILYSALLPALERTDQALTPYALLGKCSRGQDISVKAAF